MAKKEKYITWNYVRDADVTIGEEKQKKWPKVLLALLVLSIIGVGTAIYKYRWELYDYIVNPSIWLTETEVELELGREFKPEEYIYKLPNYEERYTYEYPSATLVDTNKIGDYPLEYKLTRPDGTVVISNILIHVVDKESPSIILTTDKDTLTRDESEFNCESYIDEVVDNYDKDVKASCMSNIDWTKDVVEVNYVAEDKSGNTTMKTLTLTIKDKPKPIATPAPTPTPQSNWSEGVWVPQETYTEPVAPQPAAPYINANNCMVRVGDMGALTSCLQSAQSNVGLSVDYSNVNMTVAGSYPVTFVGEGVSKTITVTVYE